MLQNAFDTPWKMSRNDRKHAICTGLEVWFYNRIYVCRDDGDGEKKQDGSDGEDVDEDRPFDEQDIEAEEENESADDDGHKEDDD
jgi:hypothetical protein